MTRASFKRAFGYGLLVCVAAGVLAAPLAPEWVGRVPVGEILGFVVIGAAVLLLIELPVLSLLLWLVRRRINVTRGAWMLVGAALAAVPIVGGNMPGESVWVKLTETIDASLAEPEVFASAWFPFLAGGGVFGWHLPGDAPDRSNSSGKP